MKKPNEKKHFYQQRQAPGQAPGHLPAPPGRLFPWGTLPETDGACRHPLGCRNFRNLLIPEVREAGKEMQHLFCPLKTGAQKDRGGYRKTGKDRQGTGSWSRTNRTGNSCKPRP